MEKFLLFFFNVVLGYTLQAAGYLVVVHAAGRLKIKMINLLALAVGLGLLSWGIRSISILSFGFHTILIMICIILASAFFLRVQVFSTVVGVLCSSMLVLCCEIIMIGLLSIFGLGDVLKSDGSTQQELAKAISGVPINVLFMCIAVVIYKIRTKSHKENTDGGEISEENS